MPTTKPKVSVCMITYNHENFIEQAVRSVLEQDVDFEIELVVGEDCSTDRTADVLRDLTGRDPERIRLILRPDNLGMMGNLLATLSECKGEYVAFLEGDDYWCDPDKLRKQVAVLERDTSVSMVFTSIWVLKDGIRTLSDWTHEKKCRYTLEDLLKGNLGYTLTFLYRNIYRDGYPAWVAEAKMGDWTLHTLQALHGDAWYLDEPTAVYRVHGGGIWSCKNRMAQCRMDEETNALLIRRLPGCVPRRALRERLVRTRTEMVRYGLVYGRGAWHGLRALLLLVMMRRWPFQHLSDVIRATATLAPGLRPVLRMAARWRAHFC